MIVEINGERYVPAASAKLKRQPFAELITKARELACESLDTASEAIGTSKSYLWELESGRSQPTLGLLQTILKHYGLAFDQIAPEPQRRRDSR